jgi:L-threonylcarbamoyladenylate synthase
MTGEAKHCPVPRWKLRQAARCFRRGGVLAYPTEAVYGLGCDPLNWPAVERILELKQRHAGKGVILIAAHFEQLLPFVAPLPEAQMRPVLESWPGAATWLLPAAPGTPPWIRGEHETVAVRVTAHPVAAALCRACDSPLVSTSANPSSQLPARSALRVRSYFGNRVDYILAGPLGGLEKPTPIRDAASGLTLRG